MKINMLICSFMRSASGVTLYDETGQYKTLDATDYKISLLMETLKPLIETGASVTVNLSAFEIKKVIADVAPAATITEDANGQINIEYKDLGLKIKNFERLKTHLQHAAISPSHAGAMRAFLANVALNPRQHSVDELLDFMTRNNLPLTKDGHVLAWKYVDINRNRGNGDKDPAYLDNFSKTIDNSVGKLVFMDATKVDPNRNVDCSVGLHICTASYLSNAGANSAVVMTKIHPAHFIAIPKDYGFAKARVCAYIVLDNTTNKPDPKQIERFFDFPIATHLDGVSIEKTSDNVHIDHAALANLVIKSNIGRWNGSALSISPVNNTANVVAKSSAPATEDQSSAPKSTAAAPAAKPKSSHVGKKAPKADIKLDKGWMTMADLSELTGRTESSLRKTASRQTWKKKLRSDGLIDWQAPKSLLALFVDKAPIATKTTAKIASHPSRAKSAPRKKAALAKAVKNKKRKR